MKVSGKRPKRSRMADVKLPKVERALRHPDTFIERLRKRDHVTVRVQSGPLRFSVFAPTDEEAEEIREALSDEG